MRDSGLLSISPNLAKSTFGHGMRFKPPPPPEPVGADAPPTTPPASADFTNFCTSSLPMRPPRWLPATCARSTPSSRANWRTAGLAYGTLPGSTASASKRSGGRLAGSPGSAMGAIAGTGAPPSPSASTIDSAARRSGRAGTSTGGTCAPVSAAGCSLRGASGSARGASAAASSAGSISATRLPSDSASPSFTFTSLIVPANGAGTSIVALSDSRVTSPWSLATVSPGLTRISITGTSS